MAEDIKSGNAEPTRISEDVRSRWEGTKMVKGELVLLDKDNQEIARVPFNETNFRHYHGGPSASTAALLDEINKRRTAAGEREIGSLAEIEDEASLRSRQARSGGAKSGGQLSDEDRTQRQFALKAQLPNLQITEEDKVKIIRQINAVKTEEDVVGLARALRNYRPLGPQRARVDQGVVLSPENRESKKNILKNFNEVKHNLSPSEQSAIRRKISNAQSETEFAKLRMLNDRLIALGNAQQQQAVPQPTKTAAPMTVSPTASDSTDGVTTRPVPTARSTPLAGVIDNPNLMSHPGATEGVLKKLREMQRRFNEAQGNSERNIKVGNREIFYGDWLSQQMGMKWSKKEYEFLHKNRPAHHEGRVTTAPRTVSLPLQRALPPPVISTRSPTDGRQGTSRSARAPDQSFEPVQTPRSPQAPQQQPQAPAQPQRPQQRQASPAAFTRQVIPSRARAGGSTPPAAPPPAPPRPPQTPPAGVVPRKGIIGRFLDRLFGRTEEIPAEHAAWMRDWVDAPLRVARNPDQSIIGDMRQSLAARSERNERINSVYKALRMQRKLLVKDAINVPAMAQEKLLRANGWKGWPRTAALLTSVSLIAYGSAKMAAGVAAASMIGIAAPIAVGVITGGYSYVKNRNLREALTKGAIAGGLSWVGSIIIGETVGKWVADYFSGGSKGGGATSSLTSPQQVPGTTAPLPSSVPGGTGGAPDISKYTGRAFDFGYGNETYPTLKHAGIAPDFGYGGETDPTNITSRGTPSATPTEVGTPAPWETPAPAPNASVPVPADAPAPTPSDTTRPAAERLVTDVDRAVTDQKIWEQLERANVAPNEFTVEKGSLADRQGLDGLLKEPSIQKAMGFDTLGTLEKKQAFEVVRTVLTSNPDLAQQFMNAKGRIIDGVAGVPDLKFIDGDRINLKVFEESIFRQKFVAEITNPENGWGRLLSALRENSAAAPLLNLTPR